MTLSKVVARRVLIIEDDEATADVLRLVLELRRFAVDVAYNGLVGLQKANALVPDVVVCDIVLPDIDGLIVARNLRADPRFNNCHLVAFSGPISARQTLAAGFDAHFVKPMEISKLVADLEALRPS
jgi:DNA-binding response OmpR family regulator